MRTAAQRVHDGRSRFGRGNAWRLTHGGCQPRVADAATLAHIVSAIMFLSMAATANTSRSVEDILQEISDQVRVLLPG